MFNPACIVILIVHSSAAAMSKIKDKHFICHVNEMEVIRTQPTMIPFPFTIILTTSMCLISHSFLQTYFLMK